MLQPSRKHSGLVGLDKFKIVENRLKRPLNSYIDFNAIAKGYAVDLIANYLKSKQIKNYLDD